MLNELTPEQEALIPVVRDQWIERALGGDTEITEEKLEEMVAWLYSKAGYDAPKSIEIFDSPNECVKRAQELGVDVHSMDSIGLSYDSGWAAFYDYFCRIGLEAAKENEDFLKYREFLQCGIWDCICLDEVFIACRRPSMVVKDEQGRLHCETGPAVTFGKWSLYGWHGTIVPERVIMDPESFTSKEIQEESNSEIKRALAEVMGWDKFIEKMDMTMVDEWTDPETGLKYELLDFKNREGDLQPRILKMQSPVVHDGSQPWYVEPVDPNLQTAQAARKWQIPHMDGGFPEVQDCNKKPDLSFQKET
jgi:hypothetical protein